MKLCISRKAKTHNMSGYTEPIYQNEHTTFISSTILWSHIQLILQMYLNMKRFKNQERSAVLLLLPIQHIDGNTIFSSFLPQARPRQLNCPLKKKQGCIFSGYYPAHTTKYQLQPYQTLRACTYTSYMVKYIANKGLHM